MPARIDASLIPKSPDLEFEKALWQNQVHLIAGLDEAGRGAWAGPVAAAAVILPAKKEILAILNGVRDSKQLAPGRRAELAPVIKATAVAWGVGMASMEEIDDIGILPATRLAMSRALENCSRQADHLLLDALFLPAINIAQTALFKGDQRSLSIASASILAKTTRDEWMTQRGAEYPDYGFSAHKGYGTALHQQKLQEYGPCQLHRRSFKPIREMIH